MADTITISGNGTPASASYVKLLTAAEATITTYDPITEASRTEISLADVDFTDSVLTADDINCGYVLTGSCKYIDLYDSDDVVLVRWTFETAINLSDTDGYSFTWPVLGVSFSPMGLDINGSFESITNGIPDGWEQLSGTQSIDPGEKHSGLRSWKQQGHTASIARTVTPIAGKIYRFSVWSKWYSAFSSPTHQNPNADITWTIYAGNSVTGTREMAAYQGWGIRTTEWLNWYLGDFVAAENDTWIGIVFYFHADDASCVWIDDLVIVEEDVTEADNPRIPLYTDANYALWGEHQQASVLRTDTMPSGDVQSGVSVNAVKGELASFQLAVRTAADWSNVTWSWTDFTGAGTIDAEQMAVSRGFYLTLPTVSYLHDGGKYIRQGLHVDPLPVEASSNLTASQTNPFFFTLTVPTDAVAGSYESTITLVKDGVDQVSKTITVNVADVTLPEIPAFDSFMSYDNTQGGAQYPWPTGTGAIDFYERTDNFFAHRCFTNADIYFTATFYNDPPWRCVVAERYSWVSDVATYMANLGGTYTKPSIPWSEFGITFQNTSPYWGKYASAGTMSIFTDGTYTTPNPLFLELFPLHVQGLLDLLESYGFTNAFKLKISDEIPPWGIHEAVKLLLADLLHSVDSRIEFMDNAIPNPENDPDHMDYCYLTGYADIPWQDVMNNYRAADKKAMVYQNNFLRYQEHHHPVKYRLFPWACFKRGYRGHNFWSVNAYYTHNPWNGDFYSSVLIYPPRTGIDEAGVPVNSVRWEAWHRGVQDYDLLYMLQELIAEKTGQVDNSIIVQAQSALDRVDEIVTHFPGESSRPCGNHYDQFCTFDLNLLEEVRQGVVDAISLLNNIYPQIVFSAGPLISDSLILNIQTLPDEVITYPRFSFSTDQIVALNSTNIEIDIEM